ncbi:MAG TPA: DUF58 domain-containing protein [Actinomycetes bacterium]|nr:DUF58 domain-containing protein [Actinomycetes bacterium]
MRAALSGLTPRGRALLASGLTAFILAAMLDQQDIMRVGLLAAALPLLSAASVARTRFRLASGRTVEPARIPAGDSATVTVRVENVSHLPTGLLMIEDAVPTSLGPRPRFVVDRLSPQSSRSVTYPVHSNRRGRYPIGPMSVRLADPFGFCRLDRSFRGQRHLLVTPKVEPLPTVPLTGDWTGTGESRARSVAASGEDDVAVRDYRHGDELRRVHWRATAKTGSLMVRREEQPWESRATVLLDDRPVAHVGDSPYTGTFERAVEASASVAMHLSHRGYAVRLVTEGREVSTNSAVDGDSGGDPTGLLLDALAVAEPDRGSSIHRLATAVRHGSDGLLVLVLGSVTLKEADQLARARHGMGTTVAIALDTASWGERHARADNEPALQLLRAAGWAVVTLRQGQALADAWGDLTFASAALTPEVSA